ncbi:Hypothetical protein TART1_2746 [Trichococcus shcherbakoviae]|uniref:Uncharacterized protein n=1 Tax=Trichococcus shcherbakoviae TaxID=2094020 RepID=A0A383THM7_9LACT|nr:Hypothetical protein TART1_2746 [Trichococcus shcherbakoviae]
MPRCCYFLWRAHCRVATSGEGLFPGGAGRKLTVIFGEDPHTGEGGRKLIATSGVDPLTGGDNRNRPSNSGQATPIIFSDKTRSAGRPSRIPAAFR